MDYPTGSALYFIDRLIPLISIYICSIIMYVRFTDIKLKSKRLVLTLCASVVLSVIIQLLGGINVITIKMLFYILICITLILIDRKNLYFTVCSSIITIAITLYTQYIGVFISGLIIYIANLTEFKIIATFVGSLIPVVICIILSRIKRLKRCFLYFEDEHHIGIGLFLSSYVFIFSLFLTQISISEFKWAIILFSVSPLIFVGIMLWIRSIVQRYRKNKLKDRINEYTQQEMAKKNEKINRLEAEVSTLAKQLHRDNHLLAALVHSVQKLSDNDSLEQKAQIIREIHTLYQERNDLMTKEQLANNNLPSTGISLIDSSLNDMYIKAAAHGISMDIIVKEKLHYLVNNIINQTDLQTLLCDHLKDAIIAIDTAKIDNGKILISIEKNEGIFGISIRDNGVSFDPNTLSKLGKERVTTHSDEGGSGIGFMTTFETLAKSKGSLAITEYKNDTPFSKSITFTFDGLNRFIISSYRKEELKSVMTRDDIILI